MNLPPGIRFFGCGAAPAVAPEDLRDLEKENITIKKSLKRIMQSLINKF